MLDGEGVVSGVTDGWSDFTLSTGLRSTKENGSPGRCTGEKGKFTDCRKIVKTRLQKELEDPDPIDRKDTRKHRRI